MKTKLFTLLTFLLLTSCVNKQDIIDEINYDYRNNFFNNEKYWNLNEVEGLNIEDCCGGDIKPKLDLKLQELKNEDLLLLGKIDSIHGRDSLTDDEIILKQINDLMMELNHTTFTGSERPLSELENIELTMKNQKIGDLNNHLYSNKEKEDFIKEFKTSNNNYKIVKVLRKIVYDDYKSNKHSKKIDTVEYLYIPKTLVIKL